MPASKASATNNVFVIITFPVENFPKLKKENNAEFVM